MKIDVQEIPLTPGKVVGLILPTALFWQVLFLFNCSKKSQLSMSCLQVDSSGSLFWFVISGIHMFLHLVRHVRVQSQLARAAKKATKNDWENASEMIERFELL